MTKYSELLIGANANGIQLHKSGRPPSNRFIKLIQEHHERLRALLDKPVILNVTWSSADDEATVRIIPAYRADADIDKPFEIIKLAFPDGGVP